MGILSSSLIPSLMQNMSHMCSADRPMIEFNVDSLFQHSSPSTTAPFMDRISICHKLLMDIPKRSFMCTWNNVPASEFLMFRIATVNIYYTSVYI